MKPFPTVTEILMDALDLDLEGLVIVGWDREGEHVVMTTEGDDHASKLGLMAWKHYRDRATGHSYIKALNS
jgi:hypothetical protein